jgi:hypothetical protein
LPSRPLKSKVSSGHGLRRFRHRFHAIDPQEAADRVALARQEVAQVSAIYGASSTQAQESERRLTEAVRAAAEQRVAIAVKEIDDQIKALAKQLTASETHNDALVKQGKLTADARAAIEVDAATKTYAAELALADREIALLDRTLPAYQAAADKRAAIEQGLTDELARIRDQAATAQAAANERTAQTWSKSFTPISSAFDTMTRGMLAGQQTTAQVMRSTALSFAETEIAADAKMLFSKLALYVAEKAGFVTAESAKLIAAKATDGGILTSLFGVTAAKTTAAGDDVATTATTEAAKTGATVTGVGVRTAAEETASASGMLMMIANAIKSIGVSAGKAAAGTWAGVSEIPYGWIIAPALAAGALAAVLKFAGAFEQGSWEIAETGLAQIHKGEMIIPAAKAQNIRSQASSGFSGFSMPAVGAWDLPAGVASPGSGSGATGATGQAGAAGGSGGNHTFNTVVNVTQTDPTPDMILSVITRAHREFDRRLRGLR